MIIATNGYPYGGEKSFVLPELKYLKDTFDIIILAHLKKTETDESVDKDFPKQIKCLKMERPALTFKDKFKAVCKYLFDADGKCELKEIFKEKRLRKERIYQSLSFYAQALKDQKALAECGVFAENQPIVYYSFWYDYFCYSAVRESRKYRNVRIITRTHGYDLYNERIPGGRQPFRHQMEAGVDKVVFACQFAKDYYTREIAGKNCPDKKMAVSRLGVEAVNYRMPLGNGKEWNILSCSNVIALKRINIIIDALSLIDDYIIKWSHIGDGEQMQEIESYAKEKLGNKKNIIFCFLGKMDNDKVHQYYREHQVDLFITTSATEGGCPVSIQEAMAYAVPVMGTAVGGITEMLAGEDMCLPADANVYEVVNAITSLCAATGARLQELKDISYGEWDKDYNAKRNVREIYKILVDDEI